MTDDSQRYKPTILLPETAFPMRGDLPKREPGTLARWEAEQDAKAANTPTGSLPED